MFKVGSLPHSIMLIDLLFWDERMVDEASIGTAVAGRKVLHSGLSGLQNLLSKEVTKNTWSIFNIDTQSDILEGFGFNQIRREKVSKKLFETHLNFENGLSWLI